jgi:hypothetical protein
MNDATSAMNQPTERPAGFQGYAHQSQAREDEELTHVDHGTPDCKSTSSICTQLL